MSAEAGQQTCTHSDSFYPLLHVAAAHRHSIEKFWTSSLDGEIGATTLLIQGVVRSASGDVTYFFHLLGWYTPQQLPRQGRGSELPEVTFRIKAESHTIKESRDHGRLRGGATLGRVRSSERRRGSERLNQVPPSMTSLGCHQA